MTFDKEETETYWFRVGTALSQVINVVFFNGIENETLSGRSYREKGQLAKIIDFIFGKDHCKDSYFLDSTRAGRFLAKRNHYVR